MVAKPDMTRVWAETAPPANVVDPDTTTPGKFSAGWQAEVPPFEHFNFLQQLFSQGLVYLNEQGIGVYDANTDYPSGGICKGSDSVLYQAQSANGPSSTPVNPVGDVSGTWLELIQSQDSGGAGADPLQWPDTANGADADHDVVINPGKILDSTGVNTINLQSAITKQLDAVWAEGNNLGGRASAVSLTADTTYHLFLISKDDGTVDAGWDTDLNASNLLTDATDYTRYRRVFSNLTDSSANIYAYKQVGDWVEWADYDLDYSQGSTGTTRVLVTAKVPQGLQTIARICSEMVSTATDIVAAWVASTDRDDVAASGVNRTLFVKSGSSTAQNVQEIHTDTSGQVAFRADNSVATTIINIKTLGYIDTRGKQ